MIRTKLSSINRLFALIARHGLSSFKMKAKISNFIELSPCITFPITAIVLKKHPDLIFDGVEYAVHGYYHFDFSRMTRSAQRRHLQKALEIFYGFGINEVGFRAPYLQTNQETLMLLNQLGFIYDSSATILWENGLANRANKEYKIALDFYQPKDSRQHRSLPFFECGMLRIPVALPDDEMLIDRLGIRDQNELYEIWSEILSQCHKRNEIFVLQLHPERYHLADQVLKKLIMEAKRKGMWLASLKDIAFWWRSRGVSERWPHNKRGVFCISGDIDRMSLYDQLISLRHTV